jgi:hypothetical protein
MIWPSIPTRRRKLHSFPISTQVRFRLHHDLPISAQHPPRLIAVPLRKGPSLHLEDRQCVKTNSHPPQRKLTVHPNHRSPSQSLGGQLHLRPQKKRLKTPYLPLHPPLWLFKDLDYQTCPFSFPRFIALRPIPRSQLLTRRTTSHRGPTLVSIDFVCLSGGEQMGIANGERLVKARRRLGCHLWRVDGLLFASGM